MLFRFPMLLGMEAQLTCDRIAYLPGSPSLDVVCIIITVTTLKTSGSRKYQNQAERSTIVLLSSDFDFKPALKRAREHGCVCGRACVHEGLRACQLWMTHLCNQMYRAHLPSFQRVHTRVAVHFLLTLVTTRNLVSGPSSEASSAKLTGQCSRVHRSIPAAVFG